MVSINVSNVMFYAFMKSYSDQFRVLTKNEWDPVMRASRVRFGKN